MRHAYAWFFLFYVLPIGGHADGLPQRHVLIVCGSGGTEEYQNKFQDWGERLQATALRGQGVSKERLIVLTDRAESRKNASPLDNIKESLARIQQTAAPEDELFVFLIGHGSFMRGISRLLLTGEDLTAERLLEWLEGISIQRQIVVNASASSAGFINILSRSDRIICTAVKSAEENNATEFMEFFLQGLEQGRADADYDQRITLLEACRFAAEETQSWYRAQGLLATEHALLDDNGDGLGERLAMEVEGDLENQSEAGSSDRSIISSCETVSTDSDGLLAARVLLIDESFSPSAPPDRIAAYLSVLDEIDEWTKNKNNMEEADYYRMLEILLLRAASVHREIREASGEVEETQEKRTRGWKESIQESFE